VEVDYFKPVGAWKREPNSTLTNMGGKTVINDTYAAPEHVASLMQMWLREFERLRNNPGVSPLDTYIWSHATFVRMHPFADENGRMARLVANIPVLQKGLLPVFIPVEKRLVYVEALATWQMASGPVKLGASLGGSAEALGLFRVLCTESFESSLALPSEATNLQEDAEARSNCAADFPVAKMPKISPVRLRCPSGKTGSPGMPFTSNFRVRV